MPKGKKRDKNIKSCAKKQGRANRDEDMEHFASYYNTEIFKGVNFKEFKAYQH